MPATPGEERIAAKKETGPIMKAALTHSWDMDAAKAVKLQQHNGSVPPQVGIWWVHGGMALVAAYLLRQRARNRPLVSLPAGWRRS